MTEPYRRNRVGVWTARPQPPEGSFSVEKGNYSIVLTRMEAVRLLEALRKALASTAPRKPRARASRRRAG